MKRWREGRGGDEDKEGGKGGQRIFRKGLLGKEVVGFWDKSLLELGHER